MGARCVDCYELAYVRCFGTQGLGSVASGPSRAPVPRVASLGLGFERVGSGCAGRRTGAKRGSRRSAGSPRMWRGVRRTGPGRTAVSATGPTPAGHNLTRPLTQPLTQARFLGHTDRLCTTSRPAARDRDGRAVAGGGFGLGPVRVSLADAYRAARQGQEAHRGGPALAFPTPKNSEALAT